MKNINKNHILNTKDVLVWGAGAIGSTIGAALVKSGRNVTFVDINDAHLAQIRAGRLTIDGPVVNMTVGAAAVRPEEVEGVYDLVLLAVRLSHTAAAMAELLPHLSPEGIVVSCQNGLGARDVAMAAGVERTVAASFFLPADYQEPGRVTYGAPASLTIGTLDAQRGPALDPVLEVLNDFSDIHVSDDIFGVVWTKMTYGALLGAAAMDHGVTADFLKEKRLRPIAVGIAREVTQIAAASGHPAQDAAWFQPNDLGSSDPARQDACVANVLEKLKGSAKQHSGYWTQIVQLKGRTELPVQFSPMLALAEAYGLAIPVTRQMLDFIGEMEAGRRSPGPQTMDALLAVALSAPR